MSFARFEEKSYQLRAFDIPILQPLFLGAFVATEADQALFLALAEPTSSREALLHPKSFINCCLVPKLSKIKPMKTSLSVYSSQTN